MVGQAFAFRTSSGRRCEYPTCRGAGDGQIGDRWLCHPHPEECLEAQFPEQREDVKIDDRLVPGAPLATRLIGAELATISPDHPGPGQDSPASDPRTGVSRHVPTADRQACRSYAVHDHQAGPRPALGAQILLEGLVEALDLPTGLGMLGPRVLEDDPERGEL